MVDMNLVGIVVIGLVVLFKFMFRSLFEGILGLIIKAGIGIGFAIGAVAAVKFCPGLALLLIVIAISLGEFFGTLTVLLGPHIPFIGPAIANVISPISAVLWTILILNIVLFILHLLSIFSLIPIVGWIILILDIVIPIVIFWLIWSQYIAGLEGIGKCFGGEGPVKVPGTGGIMIGT